MQAGLAAQRPDKGSQIVTRFDGLPTRPTFSEKKLQREQCNHTSNDRDQRVPGDPCNQDCDESCQQACIIKGKIQRSILEKQLGEDNGGKHGRRHIA